MARAKYQYQCHPLHHHTFTIDVIVFMPRVTMVVVCMVVGLFIRNVLGAAILTLGRVGIVGNAMPTLIDHMLHELVVEGVVDREGNMP